MSLKRDSGTDEFVEQLRLSTQKGMVIGSDLFKSQIKALYERKVGNLDMGRPKKGL